MGLRKFGTGEIIGTDEEDPQGISKQAVVGEQLPLWSDQDQADLVRENQEDGTSGRQLPPTA